MNSSKVETEAKFSISDPEMFAELQSLRQLDGFKFQPRGRQTVIDRYLDTHNQRLFQAGFACRLRRTNNKQVVTLKALTPAASHIHRREQKEIEAEPDQPLTDQPETWPESEVKTLVLAQARRAPLQTLFTIYQSRRIFYVLLEDRPVIEFSLDSVSLHEEDRVDFLELEAELLEEGTEADLARFVDLLRARWSLQPETQSKFERAWVETGQQKDIKMSYELTATEQETLERLTGSGNSPLARRAAIVLLGNQGVKPAEIARQCVCSVRTVRRWQNRFRQKRLAIFAGRALPMLSAVEVTAAPENDKVSPEEAGLVYPVRESVGLSPTDSLAEAGRKVMGFHFAQMLWHEPGTAAGENIEALHDMRVAIRRMRAALRIFGPNFRNKAIKSLRAGLKSTGGVLGRVRDLDVFMEKLQGYQQSLPEQEQTGLQILLDTWQAEREQARQEMLAYLDSKEYKRFKQSLFEFVKTEGLGARPIPAGVPVPYQLRHVVPGLIYDRYEAVHAYEMILDNASLETLHQLRIAFKEFRYILEYFREILGEERELVIKEVKIIQDHLGDLNDAHVASAILQDFLAHWEQSQLHLTLAKRRNPAQVATYLNSRLNERHRLLVTFPQAWERFNSANFRRNLALAISVL